MCKAEIDSFKQNKILEAKTFLVARAAKTAYQKSAKTPDQSCYKEILRKEFELKHIKYQEDSSKKTAITQANSSSNPNCDLICFGIIAIQLKKDNSVTEEDYQQLKHFLNISALPVGLIISYNQEKLKLIRILNEMNQ